MSLHKLTAGSGYDYLTRQVAALDSTEKGHTGLAAYYTQRGETPGVWIGSGLDGIDGLTVGDPVTAEQMRALFGCGLHPLAELRQQLLEGPDLSRRDLQDAARLGAPFRVVDGDVSPFRLEVARRIAAINSAAGLPADAPLPAADWARVRTAVAREFSCPSMAGSRLMLDTITIELIEADETPAVVVIRWPSKASVFHPRRFLMRQPRPRSCSPKPLPVGLDQAGAAAVNHRDIALSCPCERCMRAVVQIPSHKWRYLNRLPQPVKERVCMGMSLTADKP
jgi:hypothetical protein